MYVLFSLKDVLRKYETFFDKNFNQQRNARFLETGALF